MASASDELSFRRPKRQKVNLACSVCRHAKIKCDGARPVCGPCSKRRNRQQSCIYHPPNHSGLVSAEHSSPQNRLVNQIRGHSSLNAVQESVSPLRRSSATPSRHSDSADAMGAGGDMSAQADLLGASSATDFMRQMRKAVDGRDTSSNLTQATPSGHLTHSSGRLAHREHEWKHKLHGSEYVLPPRATANSLINIYWEYVWTIFPFVDEFEFSESYEALWHGTGTQSYEQQTFHCILNLVFALACKLDPTATPSEREASAGTYFSRARALVVIDPMTSSDLHLVQALLLMCQFLQSTRMAWQCLQSLGLAIWIGMDLGLHLLDSDLNVREGEHYDAARRIWQGCVMMDRITAMTFGRSVRIGKEHLLKILPPSDPDSTTPSRLRFFQDYYHLHLILGDVLESFYARQTLGRNTPEGQAQMLAKLIEIDERLFTWYKDLTPYLKLPISLPSGGDRSIFERQANACYARWLHVRMLLWRHFFSMPTSSASDESFVSSAIIEFTTTHCQIRCVKATQQLVALLHDSAEHPSGVSYWYTIYYLYSAATVLIAAKTFPAVVQAFPSTDLDDSIERAFHTLRTYEQFNTSAQRCVIALEMLQNKIRSKRNVAWSGNTSTPGPYQGMQSNVYDELMGEVPLSSDSWILFEGMDMFWLDDAFSG